MGLEEKGKVDEVIEAEIKVLRVKLDKEWEKVKQLEKKLIALKKHKDHIDVNNNALNWSNMLLIKRMIKIDE